MSENLNVGTMLCSSNPGGGSCVEEQTNNGFVEKYCHSNLESNCDIYGGLYKWDEISENGGICPNDWHIPSRGEWNILRNYIISNYPSNTPRIVLGSGSGGESGFKALISGITYPGGFFSPFDQTSFWSSTMHSGSDAYSVSLYDWVGWDNFYRGHSIKTEGYSVRCIRN